MLKKENEAGKNFNWKVLIIITLATMTGGLYRNGIMTLFPFIQAEYGLGKAQLGLYSTFIYISSVSVSIFSGWIADKWGTKKSMIAGLSCMGVFIFLHSYSINFVMMLLLASATGLGLSIILPTGTKGVAEWISKENRSTAVGIITLGLSLGGVIAASILPWTASAAGWKAAVILLSFTYFVVSLIFFIFYKNKKSADSEGKDGEKKDKNKKPAISVQLKILFKDKYLLALCFLGIMFGVASGITATHFTLYLYSDFGFSEVAAGFGFMVFQLGSMAGRPGWGILNDRFLGGNDKTGFNLLAVLIILTAAVLSFLSKLDPHISILLFIAFVLGSVGRGWNGLYFSAVSKQLGDENTGIGVGLSLLFVRFGIIIGPPIFGLIADKTGSYSLSWLIMAVYTVIALFTSNILLSKSEKSAVKY
ncbi:MULTISPECIES: MFS transporter [unclassified Halanaerobium]|uniref:MFS transporter n=1 Tax=unclassified Halanaerobium TaxID=2641197 RepID=UPI000E1AF3F6|nr:MULTISPECIES: MFS transporter [unclassified Halanaerobium]RCW47733.1 sugar phosphate permease [Halanaerobium sp. MA284_MarDTE_T2]RCW87980.1 sugar phosphate permease [Halanaerobium sp. DL-01]